MRRPTLPTVLLTVTIVLLVVFVGIVGLTLSKATPPVTVLSYVPQIVTDKVPGVDGPAVHLGQPVHVYSIKCNLLDKPVVVLGDAWWQNIDNINIKIQVASHTRGTRGVGCKTRTYVNPMPDGVTPGHWRLYAHEYPQGIKGGQPATWTSDTFTVVP